MAGGVGSDKAKQERVIGGSDDRGEVANTYRPPYSAVCLVQVRWPGYSAVDYGSGFIYGENTLFTCAHVLYDWETRKRALRVAIAPGVTCGTMPFGYAVVDTSAIRIFPGYEATRDPWTDLGAVILPGPLGRQTGWAGLDTADRVDVGDEIVVTGFPSNLARPNLADFRMLRGLGRIAERYEGYAFHTADATGGNSGGPIWRASERIPYVTICGVLQGERISEHNTAVMFSGEHHRWMAGILHESGVRAGILSESAESEARPDGLLADFAGEGPSAPPLPLSLMTGDDGAPEAGAEATAPPPGPTAGQEQEFRIPARGKHVIALDLAAGAVVSGAIKVALPDGSFTDCDLTLETARGKDVDRLSMFVYSSGPKDFKGKRFSFAALKDGSHRLTFRELNGASAAIVRLKLKIG